VVRAHPLAGRLAAYAEALALDDQHAVFPVEDQEVCLPFARASLFNIAQLAVDVEVVGKVGFQGLEQPCLGFRAGSGRGR